MDLKIKDVAQLINVSETTIRRWISEGKIPAYKIKDQFRFSLMEIENWMMKKNNSKSNFFSQKMCLKDEATKKLLEKQINPQAYSLYRAVYRGGVVINVDCSSKIELIKNTVKIIAKDFLKLDEDILARLLLDRENLMPTGLNHGIAVPHTRDFLLPKPMDVIMIVYPKKPIKYGSLDGKKVHTLFFLFACEEKRHLHLLAKIAHLTKLEKNRKFFQQKPDKEKVLAFIKNWEKKIIPFLGEASN